MKGLMTIMPDGSYEVKSFATDDERNNVAAYETVSRLHPREFQTERANYSLL